MPEVTPYAVGAADVSATNDQLKQISVMVAAIRAQRAIVAETAELLKVQQETLRNMEENDLPAVMDEAGIAQFTTSDGTPVKVEQQLFMSVPKKNKAAVASWLLGHGHGALVQSDVILQFKKGEADKVTEAIDLLNANGFANAHIEESMHTGQLKALVKELRDNGEDVPMELFGAFVKRVAVVK